MRFKIEQLREPVKVEIKGDEPWLDYIYKSFNQKQGPGQPLLTGYFTVSPDQYGAFHVKGEVSYTPQVSCGRCELLIPWEIKRKIDVRYLVPYRDEDEDQTGREKDLTPEDLDDYYIENDEIDVEISINDLIQTALPSRLIKLTPDGKACAICLENVETAVAYEQKSAPENSPFAVLKNLKLPE